MVTSIDADMLPLAAAEETNVMPAPMIGGVRCRLTDCQGVPATLLVPIRIGTLALLLMLTEVTVRKSLVVVALTPAPADEPLTDSETEKPPWRVPVKLNVIELVSAAVLVKTIRRCWSSGMLLELTVMTDVAAVLTLPTKFVEPATRAPLLT